MTCEEWRKDWEERRRSFSQALLRAKASKDPARISAAQQALAQHNEKGGSDV